MKKPMISGILLFSASGLEFALIFVSIITVSWIVDDANNFYAVHGILVVMIYIPASIFGIVGGVLSLKERRTYIVPFASLILGINALAEGIYRLIITSGFFGWGVLAPITLAIVGLVFYIRYWQELGKVKMARELEENKDFVRACKAYYEMGDYENSTRLLNIVIQISRHKGNLLDAIALCEDTGAWDMADILRKEKAGNIRQTTSAEYKRIIKAYGYETAMNYKKAGELFKDLGMHEDYKRCRKLMEKKKGKRQVEDKEFTGKDEKQGGFDEYGQVR